MDEKFQQNKSGPQQIKLDELMTWKKHDHC